MNTICPGCNGLIKGEDFHVLYDSSTHVFVRCPTCYKSIKLRKQEIRGRVLRSGSSVWEDVIDCCN